MIKLYDHNKKAYKNVIDLFEEEDRVAVIHPTGTGKMYVGLKWLYENRDKKCLFLAPTKAVMYQLKDTIFKSGLSLDDFPNLDLVLYSQLSNWKDEDFSNKYDCIVMDEFHRAGAPKWEKSVNKLLDNNKAKTLGLSATPKRYVDGRNMADEMFEGNIASYITLAEALVSGILPFPIYVNTIFSLDFEKYQNKINDLKGPEKIRMQELLDQAKNNLDKVSKIEDILKKYVDKKNGKYIVFCRDIKHLEEMKEKANEWFKDINENITFYDVHSKHKASENENTLNAFNSNNDSSLKLLFSVEMLNEGLHVDNIDGVIMLRPTNSHIIYLQQLGRALAANGNIRPLIIDIVNNIEAYESIYKLKEEIERICIKNNINIEEINEKFQIHDYVRNVMEILQQIDQSFNKSFYDWIGLLKEYLENNKIENLTSSTMYNGFKLGLWVKEQKNKSRRGQLSLSEIKELKSLGIELKFEKEVREYKTFENWVSILEDYLKEFNIENLKRTTVYKNENLGLWVHKQRSKYFSGKLGVRETNVLELLGVSLEKKVTQKSFKDWLIVLKDYLKDNDISDLKQTTIYKGVNLGSWINSQKTKYRRGRLDDNEKKQLELLGVTIESNVKKKTFDEWVAILKDYLLDNDISDLKQSTVYKGENLGSWFNNQKTNYRKGNLSEEQLYVFNNLGFKINNLKINLEKLEKENEFEISKKEFISSDVNIKSKR